VPVVSQGKKPVHSMTGFGAGESIAGASRIGVEIRSVNHRYLDVTVKGPREYAAIESRVTEGVRARVRRGKVDVFLSRNVDPADPGAVHVDLALARRFHTALARLQTELGLPGEVSVGMIAGQRDVIIAGGAPADPEADWPAIEKALSGALGKLEAMRADEGKRLLDDLRANAASLRTLAASAKARAPAVVEEYRVRLQDRLAKLLGDRTLDETRLAQEVAILADRADVHEELVRLASHLDQLDQILAGGGDIGRKLDFLLQEVGREVNTLGSKANDAELARIVVELKAVAERIREQIQNLE
jgi:uncharacterized protein (TIGR00255 family)